VICDDLFEHDMDIDRHGQVHVSEIPMTLRTRV
jgi:hypothetical protein